MKLGTPVERAVVADEGGAPRDLAGASGSAGTSRSCHSPSGKLSNGPRSRSVDLLVDEGRQRSSKPSAGTVTAAPITAPRPSVAPSRNMFRGNVSLSAVGVGLGLAGVAGGARPRPAPRRLGRRRLRLVSLHHVADPQEAKTTVIARAEPAPAGSTTSPTRDRRCRRQTRPARGSGWEVRLVVPGPGFHPVVPPRLVGQLRENKPCCGADGSPASPLSAGDEPVVGPAAVDERPHLGAHLDPGRPLPRALVRALLGRVDAELAAIELPGRRVVEVVERAFREQHVAAGVDVRADRGRTPARSRGRAPTRRRSRPPWSARASRGPRSRASPSGRGRGTPS